MKIHDCEQYSPEWWALRRGLPTASQFSRIITPSGALSKSSLKYAVELIADSITTSETDGGYKSAAMERGSDLEDEARKFYEFDRGVEVVQVGLCVADNGNYGVSPDSLVGDDGCLEIKCPLPKTHVGYLLAGELPSDYKAQVHGHLLVTGRAWCDFMSYCPELPALIVRVKRDAYTASLGESLDAFVVSLDDLRADIDGLCDEVGLAGSGARNG